MIGGRENEGKWKPSWNIEMSEGWVLYIYIYMGSAGLNMGILFFG